MTSLGLFLLRKLLATSVPFVGSVACARDLHMLARAAVVAGFIALLFAANTPTELAWLVGGWIYLTLAAVCAYGVTRAFPDGVPSRAGLLAMLAYLFVVAPRSVLGPSAAWVQPLGWEMAFAAYSFCVETAGAHRRSDLRTCLSFVVVNPVLVFADRGQRVGPVGLRSGALWRISTGALSWAAKLGLLGLPQGLAWLAPLPFRSVTTGAGYLRFTAHHGVQLLAGYAGHSGRASVHIGWMGLLGHSVPERYDWALLARTPAEFWRRWNTYIGSWVRRYVFTPISLMLRRRQRRWPAFVVSSIAVLVAFALMGFAHDFALAAARTSLSLDVTALFLVHGAVLLAWTGMARRIRPRGIGAQSERPGARGAAGWLALMHLLVLTVWWVQRSPAAEAGDRMSELGALVGAGSEQRP